MHPVLETFTKLLDRARKSSDVVLAMAMAAIIGAMIVPLPEWLLDLGLALNLTAGLSLLVAALYARDALKVATFPTLLLVTTLFRLAMNVSSTRLALSEGHAGHIIQAFGEFVVRGDYVVGAVIFAILTLVQFLVVTKGAERVAEVSARFTLDAMPGKQMSIDADLRAGAISQDQARGRRRELERESQLFGSMDGAMKFVKGDVIAGLLITLINLLGGTVIGVLQNDMGFQEAAATYALIAIGDGLVSQIPSLCVAVAAGLVVTRVSSEHEDTDLGSDIGSQFFGQWKALWVVAGLTALVGLMPGMPHFTFVAIAAALGGLGAALRKASRGPASIEKPVATAAAAPSATASASATPAPGAPQVGEVSPLMLDLAKDLTELVTRDGGSFVSVHLAQLRERLMLELGVKLPSFRVRTGAPFADGGWLLQVDELPCARGVVKLGQLAALASTADLASIGVQGTPAPELGPNASWVPLESKAKLEAAQVPVREAASQLCDALLIALRRRVSQFLGVQEVQALLAVVETNAPTLVREAQTKVPLPLLTEVLRRLLQEQVSVRNLRAILEALVSPAAEGDAQQLAERCRQALHRQLSHQHSGGGPLHAWLVDPALEDAVRQAGPQLALDPSVVSAVVDNVRRIAAQGRGVLLTAADVRRPLRRLLEGAFPELAVLTYGELDRELQVKPLGRLAATR